MSIQPGVIKEMKIDQDMVDIAMQELRAAKVKF
jgi:DNA-directed RNA polymerase subunit K/omega